MEDEDEVSLSDDLDVEIPSLSATVDTDLWTAAMQEKLVKKYKRFLRTRKRLRQEERNASLSRQRRRAVTAITATMANPAENGLAVASDQAVHMKAGVLSGETSAQTTVIGGGPFQQQQAPQFSTADVPPPSPGVPRAILTCRPNSHPFHERVLNLDQPAKVGRPVAQCREAPNNAIFDCKVLSRKHALLWYEGGKFYLQDTKSTNGTFVNNQRLSKTLEESPAQEVCSGDIVQFGNDGENTRNVLRGCIAAALRLFLPDGKEAEARVTQFPIPNKMNPSTTLIPDGAGAAITTQELYELSQCIQEALHREQTIQNKMDILQGVLAGTQEATENNWKATIEEDVLLNRIETLEAQLQACEKSATDDKLREEITRLHEERAKYEDTAKMSLKKVLQEKWEALQRVQELEYTVFNSEDECVRMGEMYDAAQKEISTMTARSDKHQKEIVQLQAQLKEYGELNQAMSEEKTALENQIQELQKAEQALAAKIESLRADNDFAMEQLAAMKSRCVQVKKAQYIQDGLEALNSEEGMPNYKDSRDSRGELFTEKSLADASVKESATQPEKESELSKSKELEINVSSSVTTLQEEAKIQSVLTSELQAKVFQLEEQLEQLHSLGDKGRHENLPTIKKLRDEIARLRELVSGSREKVNAVEAELAAMKDSQLLAKAMQAATEKQPPEEASEEKSALTAQLTAARKHVQDQACQIVRLQGELSQSEHALFELREQVFCQRQQLSKYTWHFRLHHEKLSGVKNLLEEEIKAWKRTEAESEALEKQLHKAQNRAKQQQNEAENLRRKVRILTEVLRNRAKKEQSLTPNPGLNTIQEKCETLRALLSAAEEEVSKQRDENVKLLAEHERLRESCGAFSVLSSPPSVPGDRGDWPGQLEKMHHEAQTTRHQLQESAKELALLKDKYSVCALEKAQLQQELKAVSDERQLLLYQSRTTSACSVIPLCILVLAILMGFYPTLS